MVVYTFRTFASKHELENIFGQVFVFSKLKEDLATMKRLLLLQKPPYILGIASTKGYSRLERYAVNKFNNKSLQINGPDKLYLHIPPNKKSLFHVSEKPTHSFCNWTMYHLQTFILQAGLDTKLIFVHVSVHDLGRLESFYKLLTKAKE